MNQVLTFEWPLMPGPSCLICDREHVQIGGYRIVAEKQRGVTVNETKRLLSDPGIIFSGHIELDSEYPVFVNLWGDSSIWNQSVLEKAARQASRGQRPWFCQKCGDRACKFCGKPYPFALATHCVHDDGEVTHSGFLPIKINCLDENCLGYLPVSGGLWSCM